MPLGLAKNLEYQKRNDSASFGTVGRDPLVLVSGLISSIFKGRKFCLKTVNNLLRCIGVLSWMFMSHS